MLSTNTTALYVRDVRASMAFYTAIMGCEVVQFAPTFALVLQEEGSRIALLEWDIVAPHPTPPGGMELAFSVQEDADVDALHRAWQALGVPIVQPPTRVHFIYGFLATDPDGHRLRVFRPHGFDNREA